MKTPQKLSDDLQVIIRELEARDLSLERARLLLKHRAYLLLLVFLALPFCTPLPMPGVSMFFGIVVFWMGLRLMFGQNPGLPKKLLKKKIKSNIWLKIFKAMAWIVKKIEFFLKPRLQFLFRITFSKNVIGAMLMLSGLLLMLPLPIPFSNGIPAFTVVLLSSAMLEEDGYFLIAGTFSFLVSVFFFIMLFFGGASAIKSLFSFILN